mmetsp:Transcript_27508/g.57403  ORF Transcript_27508/g.57403 Transcript_27508/m.57403 type:complete len:127 (+) Transcript_27508:1537-1917(+)
MRRIATSTYREGEPTREQPQLPLHSPDNDPKNTSEQKDARGDHGDGSEWFAVKGRQCRRVGKSKAVSTCTLPSISASTIASNENATASTSSVIAVVQNKISSCEDAIASTSSAITNAKRHTTPHVP